MAPTLLRHPTTSGTAAGPPLLLVHGLGGDRHSWTPVIEPLRERADVLVAELPGFGTAPPLSADVVPTPLALARSLTHALDDQGVPLVHAVGVSLGGWVALELGGLGRAASVTALAPAGFWSGALGGSTGTARRLARRADRALPALLASPGVRRRVLGGVLGGPGAFDRADAVAVIRGYARATDFGRTDAAMRASAVDRDAVGALAARIPVELVWGARDRLVRAPRTPLAPAIGQRTLPDAGHLPMFDDPAGTLAAIDDALRRAADGSEDRESAVTEGAR